MKKIENVDQLEAEIARLKGISAEQKKMLKNDFFEIRESFKPVNLLVNGLSSVTGVKMEGNELLKDGLAYGLSVVLQRYVLKTERKMEKKVYEFVDSVIERVKAFIEKFTSHDAKRNERMQDDNPEEQEDN